VLFLEYFWRLLRDVMMWIYLFWKILYF